MEFSTGMELIAFTIFIFRLGFAHADCGFIDTPHNSRVVVHLFNKTGSSIEFECSQGYEMQGDAKMICQANGEWKPRDPPTCKIKTCGEFKTISNATVLQEESRSGVRNSFGSIVHVKCDSGFILKGLLRVKCQADGTWEERPYCVRSKCPPYPGLKSSCIKKTLLSVDMVFLYIYCRDDIPTITKGSGTVECIDGEWKASDRSACYCDCFVNADFEKVSINGANEGYIGHTSTLSWTCKTGFIKNVTEPLVCDDGKIGTPICVPGQAQTVKPGQPAANGPTWLAFGLVIGAIAVVLIAFGYLLWRQRIRRKK